MTNPYDLVRYPNWPVFETHPAMLGAFAVLFGRRAAPVSACRVLEIGCGEGVNLMSMAVGLPKSEFVGLDLAEAPIGLGRTMARAAGLDNVSLFARDVKDGSAALDQFDYVITHGVYAWVPAAVREALMRLAAQCLSPDGLFFVSYNVRPGCRLRQALRDLMLEAVQGLENPAEKTEAARNALARFIETWSPKDAFQNALIEEARDALTRPPSLLYHDELGDIYAPQFLFDVVAAARAERLDYLCDAKPGLSAEALFPSEKYARRIQRGLGALRADDGFCRHAAIPPIDLLPGGRDRSAAAVRAPQRPLGERRSYPSRPNAGEPDGFAFRAHNGAEIVTHDPRFAAVLASLGKAFPQCIPLDDMRIRRSLSHCCGSLSTGSSRFKRSRRDFTTAPGERPRASPLGKLIAAGNPHPH